MEVVHEIAAERGQEEHTQDAAQEGHQEDLEEARLQPQDMHRGHDEDAASGDDSAGGADGEDVHVLQQRGGTALQELHGEDGETHRQDGNGDGALDALAQLQGDVGRGRREHDGPEEPGNDAPDRDFGWMFTGGYDRLIVFARVQFPEGIIREAETVLVWIGAHGSTAAGNFSRTPCTTLRDRPW